MLPRRSHFSFAFINNWCSTPSSGPWDFCLYCKQILLNRQKLSRVTVLETFISWNSQHFAHVFKSASSRRFQLNPQAHPWQGLPLYCAHDVGWVFKWAFYSPSVVSSLSDSAVSNPFAMAVKGCQPRPAVNLPLPIQKRLTREKRLEFSPPVSQTCSPAVWALGRAPFSSPVMTLCRREPWVPCVVSWCWKKGQTRALAP